MKYLFTIMALVAALLIPMTADASEIATDQINISLDSTTFASELVKMTKEERVEEILLKGLEKVETTGKFLIGESSRIVKSFIKYLIIIKIIHSVLALIGFIVLYKSSKLLFNYSSESVPFIVFLNALLGMPLVVWLIYLINGFVQLIAVPEIYLLEYFNII